MHSKSSCSLHFVFPREFFFFCYVHSMWSTPFFFCLFCSATFFSDSRTFLPEISHSLVQDIISNYSFPLPKKTTTQKNNRGIFLRRFSIKKCFFCSFGKRTGQNHRRTHNCLLLQESEMIVV